MAPLAWVYDTAPRISQNDGEFIIKADPVFTEMQWFLIIIMIGFFAFVMPLLLFGSFESLSARMVFVLWVSCICALLFICMHEFSSSIKLDQKSRTLSISTRLWRLRKAGIQFDDILEISVRKVFYFKGIKYRERVEIDVAYLQFKEDAQSLKSCSWLLGAALLCVDPLSMESFMAECLRQSIQVKSLQG